jgi:hypothetical protein
LAGVGNFAAAGRAVAMADGMDANGMVVASPHAMTPSRAAATSSVFTVGGA